MRKLLFYILLIMCSVTACKKEIDFDYNEIDPIVVVEGRVTNEGTEVMVTKSRSVTDSVKSHCLPGAVVTVSSADGVSERIDYDSQAQCYRSPLKGRVGETYRLTVDFEGHHYEGTSTMPPQAPILFTEFFWFSVLDERMVVYEMWANDPEPNDRNYLWYRIDRISHHPHFAEKKLVNPYVWNVIGDRGNPPGLLFCDVYCMTERMADDDEEENWERILYEGDTITFQMMTIDRTTFDYFTSLRAGQSGGANPWTNLTGGCQGYFTAASLSRADTLVFHYDSIRPQSTFHFDYDK